MLLLCYCERGGCGGGSDDRGRDGSVEPPDARLHASVRGGRLGLAPGRLRSEGDRRLHLVNRGLGQTPVNLMKEDLQKTKLS